MAVTGAGNSSGQIIDPKTGLPFGVTEAANTTPVKDATPTVVSGETKPVTSADLPAPQATLPGNAAGIAQLVSGANLDKVPDLALIPGKYKDSAVSLTDVIAGLGKTPNAQAVVKALIAEFQATTGIAIQPGLQAAAMGNPSRILDALNAKPEQLAAGVDAINALFQTGKLPDIPGKTRLLPQFFDLKDLASAPHKRPTDFPRKELIPEMPGALFQGDLPNTKLSDAQAKSNQVFAEILDRLGDNADTAKKDAFHVTYKGKSFTRVDAFLKALQKDGHIVEVTVDHRIANFANLKTVLPDGSIRDVPAALMVKTGFKDKDGNEAVVPSTHSELTINIRKGTAKDGFDADIKWYQGISGTGFFPAEMTATPEWCGRKIADKFTGEKAIDAVELAGLMGDVINASAKKEHLAVGGYGATGVCNDSVSIIQQAVAGRITAYPLLMRDETLADEFQKRISDKDTFDDKRYKRLMDAVKTAPRDDFQSQDPMVLAARKFRALFAIPWEAGQEPFQSTVNAKLILDS
ncbi:MAG: hypothetical protein U1E65_15405 [Myxococcota bacterium]